MPTPISPYLFYEDAAAAVDWLVEAFGFSERMRIENDDGALGHAELELGEGVVMLGQPGAGYENPKSRGRATAGVHVYVDDVDEHFERAKAAGATILMEPADQPYGDRRYDAEDPEGQPWYFAQRLD